MSATSILTTGKVESHEEYQRRRTLEEQARALGLTPTPEGAPERPGTPREVENANIRATFFGPAESAESGDSSKKDAGKLRYDLIPVEPLRELARVYTIGAEKYAPRGWESGMDWSRIVAAMQRHTEAWRGGETHDPVDGQHHLSSVAWCALALMEYERTHPELDDRP